LQSAEIWTVLDFIVGGPKHSARQASFRPTGGRSVEERGARFE